MPQAAVLPNGWMYHKETNNSLIDWRLIFETKGFVEISNLYRDTPMLAPTTHGVGKIGHFWAIVCKTVHPIRPFFLSVCPVCL